MFDHTPSRNGDSESFVPHKSDQSIFSLTIKSMGSRESIAPSPAGIRGFLSTLRAMRAPVWLSRDRTGKSVKGPLIKLVERITK